MIADAKVIQWASALPEQYYLVQKLQRWRHVEVAWNCEVMPYIYIEKPEK